MLPSVTDRRSKKGLLVVGVALPTFMGLSLWLHAPTAHAQGQENPTSPPVSTQIKSGADDDRNAGSKGTPLPETDQAQVELNVHLNLLRDVILTKMKYANAIQERIDALLQVISLSEQSINDLTYGVIKDGTNDFDSNIRQTQPRIKQLQKVAADCRYRIAVYAIERSNLDGRIAQLLRYRVGTLRPDPDELLRLRKEYNTGVSNVVEGISPDDPRINTRLDTIQKVREQSRQKLEREEAKVCNGAADWNAAALELEQFEHERNLREHEDSIVTQWKEHLLSNPDWRGEVY